MADISADRATAGDLLAGEIDGVTLDPFRFGCRHDGGRWKVDTHSRFAGSLPPMKFDVGPPCWLETTETRLAHTGIQDRYDFDLPQLPAMAPEENLAEKTARLNRTATARDAVDLVWAASTSPHSNMDRDRVRRLVTLRVWVDNHGLNRHWTPAPAARPFDPSRWLSPRDQWDDQTIGLLAHPPPTLEGLARDLARCYAWLTDLDESERRFARAEVADHDDVVAAVADLPGAALPRDYLWIT